MNTVVSAAIVGVASEAIHQVIHRQCDVSGQRCDARIKLVCGRVMACTYTGTTSCCRRSEVK